MGRFLNENERWMRHIAKDLYSLEGNLTNPPKVFIDDIESCFYIQDHNTPYDEFYLKKDLEDGQGFDFTRSKKSV